MIKLTITGRDGSQKVFYIPDDLFNVIDPPIKNNQMVRFIKKYWRNFQSSTNNFYIKSITRRLKESHVKIVDLGGKDNVEEQYNAGNYFNEEAAPQDKFECAVIQGNQTVEQLRDALQEKAAHEAQEKEREKVKVAAWLGQEQDKTVFLQKTPKKENIETQEKYLKENKIEHLVVQSKQPAIPIGKGGTQAKNVRHKKKEKPWFVPIKITISSRMPAGDREESQQILKEFYNRTQSLYEMDQSLEKLQLQSKGGLLVSKTSSLRYRRYEEWAAKLQTAVQLAVDRRKQLINNLKNEIKQEEDRRQKESLRTKVVESIRKLGKNDPDKQDVVKKLKKQLDEVVKDVGSIRGSEAVNQVFGDIGEYLARQNEKIQTLESANKKKEAFKNNVEELKKQLKEAATQQFQMLLETVEKQEKDQPIGGDILRSPFFEDWLGHNMEFKSVSSSQGRVSKKKEWKNDFDALLKTMQEDVHLFRGSLKESYLQEQNNKIKEIFKDITIYHENLTKITAVKNAMPVLNPVYRQIQAAFALCDKIKSALTDISIARPDCYGESRRLLANIASVKFNLINYKTELLHEPTEKNAKEIMQKLNLLTQPKIDLEDRKVKIVARMIASGSAPVTQGRFERLNNDDLIVLEKQLDMLDSIKKVILSVRFWRQQVSGIGGYRVEGLQVPDGVGEMIDKVISNENLSVSDKLYRMQSIASLRLRSKGIFGDKPVARAEPTQRFYKLLDELNIVEENSLDESARKIASFDQMYLREKDKGDEKSVNVTQKK